MDASTETTHKAEAPWPTASGSIRDQIRESVINSTTDDVIVNAFGHDIAIRPPELTALMAYRDFQDDEYLLARAIVQNCYVPGTNDRVFEEADIEAIGGKRFGPDMKKLNSAIQKMLGDEKLVAEIEDNTKSPTT